MNKIQIVFAFIFLINITYLKYVNSFENKTLLTSLKRKLKILVFNPELAFSHIQFQNTIAEILANEGHEVVNIFKFNFILKLILII